MRNTLLALALASVFNSVVAREASFYGVADMYIAINNDSGHISTDVQSGGTNASLIGLEGKETLSSDLSAIFRLEAGVLMDDGTSAPPGGGSGYLFQRESWVGLDSQTWGRLTFGRQYTPHFMTLILSDPSYMSMGSAIGSYCWPGTDSLLGGAYTMSDNARRDNSILYTSPSFGGWKIELFGAFGENKTATGYASSTLGNAYNVALKYRPSQWMLRTSVFIEQLSKAPEIREKDTYWTTGLRWNGTWTQPSLLFVKKFSRDTATSPDVWALQLATSTPLGSGTLLTSVAMLKNESVSHADAVSYGIRYDYPLSQRTKVYVGLAGVQNESASSKVMVPGAGSSAPFAIDAVGNDQQQLFMGVSHRF